jgi:hypothetical protein
MTDYERGVRDAIRYHLTHTEVYRSEPGEPRTNNGEYRILFEPDRVNAGELTVGSAAHREHMIELWQAAAVAALDKTRARPTTT